MSISGWFRLRIARSRARIQWIRTPERLKRQASVHEAGHALAAWLLPTFKEIMRVTVLPEGDFRGYTLATHVLSVPPEPEEVSQLMTMGMAGAAAERLLIGRSDAGSLDDLIRTLAWWLMYRSGLNDRAAVCVAAALVMELASEDPIRRLRAQMITTPPLAAAASRAVGLLSPRLAELERLAGALRRRKTLDHAWMAKILGPRPS